MVVQYMYSASNRGQPTVAGPAAWVMGREKSSSEQKLKEQVTKFDIPRAQKMTVSSRI